MNEKLYSSVLEPVISGVAVKAIKYINSNHIIRAVRRTFKGKIDKRDKTINISFSVGKPNFAEREFIKRFGILKSVQLKLYNPKKKKLVRNTIKVMG